MLSVAPHGTLPDGVFPVGGQCVGHLSVRWCETLYRRMVPTNCYALDRRPCVHMKSIAGNYGQGSYDRGCRGAHLSHAWAEDNNVMAAGHDLRSLRPIARWGEFPGVSGTLAGTFLRRRSDEVSIILVNRGAPWSVAREFSLPKL